MRISAGVGNNATSSGTKSHVRALRTVLDEDVEPNDEVERETPRRVPARFGQRAAPVPCVITWL